MSQLKKIQVGDTFQMFWVNSLASPSSVIASVVDGNENIVSSGTAVSSGGGHFYRNTSVNTQGYYVAQWRVTIAGNLYIRKSKFRAILGEVD